VRRRRPVRRGPVLVACGVIALLAAPAQASPGGAATVQASPGGAATAAATQAQTGASIAFAPLRSAGATWYGPGLYGNQTACGQILRPATIGVAHRTLPCGTPVKFVYRGRQIVTRVIDRGPYSAGNSWDLTNGARKALGFEGSDNLLYAVALGDTGQTAASSRRPRG
jgi:peptidoglycan lytic transglycosylase